MLTIISPLILRHDLIINTNTVMNHNLNQDEQQHSTTFSPAANSINNEHSVERRETDQSKRSIPEHDDLNIKQLESSSSTSSTILPSDSDADGLVVYENNKNGVFETCCPQSKCVCKKNICVDPNCDAGYVPIVMNQPVGVPGNCCPIFQCGMAPNCTELENGYSWKENCKTCNCFDNQSLCIDTICLTANALDMEMEGNHGLVQKECYSQSHRRPFFHGQSWTEDECTECECVYGLPKCHTTLCKPVLCESPIKVPGECCPKCDSFCRNHQHCDKSCKNGFVVDQVFGCSLCECASAPPTVMTTTTTTPAPVIPVTTTTSSLSERIPSSSSISTMHINIINNNHNTNQHHNNSGNVPATFDDKKDMVSMTFATFILMLISVVILCSTLSASLVYYFMRNKKTYNTVPTSNRIVYKTPA